jgi:hypothetical protein
MTRIFCALMVTGLLATTAHAQLFTSVAPEARTSITNGPTVTYFASAINSGSEALTNCRPIPGNFPAGNFGYQTVDANNQLTGSPNTPVEIAAGATQGFLLSYTPGFDPYAGLVDGRISCDQRESQYTPYLSGTLAIENGVQIPDIIAISATPSGDGVIRLNRMGGAGVMAVAAVNIGIAGDVLVAPQSLGTFPGLATYEVCETDAAAQCIGARASSLTVNFAANQVRTFAVFARGNSQTNIPFYPDIIRVRLLLSATSSGRPVGLTSAALTSPAPENATQPAGIYGTFFQEPEGNRGGAVERLDNGIAAIFPDGRTFLWGRGGIFGGGHSEWLSGTRNTPIENNRIVSDASLLHLSVGASLSTVNWTLNLNPELGLTGRYNGSNLPDGSTFTTIEQFGRIRGVWLGNLNRRQTAIEDLAGNWLVVAGNQVVGDMTMDASGNIANGRFRISGFTGCQYSGGVTRPDDSLNLFALNLTFPNRTNCGVPFNQNAFEGFISIDVAAEGPIPSGGQMIMFLQDDAPAERSGFSLLLVKA